MTIETTKEVFNLIFSSNHHAHSEHKETYNKHFYTFNDQQGIVLHNINNDIFQYYLIDINA